MGAAVRNIVFEVGAIFQWDLTLKTPAGAVISLAGCTGYMQVRQRTGEPLIVAATVTPGGGSVTAANGGLLVEVAAASIAALDFTDAQYDLFLVFPGAVPRKIARGGVTLEDRITTSF